MNPRLKSALVLAGVFGLGGVTGGGVARFLALRRMNAYFDAPPTMRRQRVFVAALDREVHLDDGQLQEVHRIVAEHEPEMREIRRAMAPRATLLRRRTLEEVRVLLRPDQQESFQRFVERQDARARAWGEALPEDSAAPPPPPAPR